MSDKVLFKEKGRMSFEKRERSYFTPAGWRLATVEEARGGLDEIKELGILNKWEKARLLDGWISGPGYDFKIGDDFRMCLGHMLVVPTDSSDTVYGSVTLSAEGKHVALLLCAQDWNFEVVYWLLNSWLKTEILDVEDVRNGKVPLNNVEQFKDMSNMINFLARKFEEEGTPSDRNFSDPNSVTEVLSGMIKIAEKQKESNYRLFGKEFDMDNTLKKLSEIMLEPIWDLLSECFASSIIDFYAYWGLEEIKCQCETETISENNFKIVTGILFYISRFRCQIIHSQPGHSIEDNCACYLSKKAVSDPQRFKEMIENNTMWRCYKDNGGYDVLNKLLVLVAMQGDAQVVNMLVDCVAECETTLEEHAQSVLHYVSGFSNEDEGLAVAEKLLGNCSDAKRLLNTKDSNGWTALHWAVLRERLRICKLFLEYGGESLTDESGRTALHWAACWDRQQVYQFLFCNNEKMADAGDADGQTVLHLAAEKTQIKVLYELMKEDIRFADVCPKKDGKGRTVFDIAVGKPDLRDDIKFVAKLLSKCKKPEEYFNKINRRQLLRQSLLDGYADIVGKLVQSGTNLPDGDGDDAGKTTLHLAAVFEDENTAMDMVKKIVENTVQEEKENFVATCDRKGRTCLHEAADKGYTEVAVHLINNSQKVIKIADCLGQTALHKATFNAHSDIIKNLFQHGAHPLEERDLDGRTALHYAVQAKSGQDGVELAELILNGCKRDEERALLLWASAAGVGTADQNIRDLPLQNFLAEQKNKFYPDNLLKTAACLGNIEMTKELLTRGGEIADIQDRKWRKGLNDEDSENVKTVLHKLENISQQGSDQPTISDNLDRVGFAYGLAVLLLNPYVKPPIAVGIFGNWGSGKSSLMLQIEGNLLKTSAEFALLTSSPTSNFPGVKDSKLSKTGKKKYNRIRRQLDLLKSDQYSGNFFMDVINKIMDVINKIKRSMKKENNEGSSTQESGNKADKANSLVDLLNNYDPKYHEIFKSLAVMDRSDMFTTNMHSSSRRDSLLEGSVPAILTVRYNAWKYKNETEALAGMAVEISKEMEKRMTKAQWLSMCWRNTWRKEKYSIWIEIIFPCLLIIVLACSFVLIVWLLLERFNLKGTAKAKYACLPLAVVSIAWTLTKAVSSILNPVSSQLMYYMKTPAHIDKLGYQERVISDIWFLKDEIGKKPCWVFSIYGALVRWITDLKWWVTYLFSNLKCSGETWAISKVMPASCKNLRIIVFVDDLDRCDESVILQVLSAVNLVLAVCEISVVLGMDKEIMARAVVKKYGDQVTNESSKACQEFSDKYMEKIIQLPLELPEPSEKQLWTFLKRQLGVFQEEGDKNAPTPTMPGRSDGDSSEGGLLREDEGSSHHVINVSPKTTSISIREMLFIKYNEGELRAFQHFKTLTSHKHPRQWKVFLNYHRLVWNILSLTNEAKDLVRWQEQLITWIFICWEWQDNMNILIEKWNDILTTLQHTDPSFHMIVEHFVKNLSSNEPQKSEEKDVSNVRPPIKDCETNGEVSPNKLDDVKKQLQSLEKGIKELKEQVMKEESKKNDRQVEVEKVEIKEQNWRGLMLTLEKYDVTMEGIQIFQKFRFHCKAQYLSRLPKEKNVKI